MSSAPHKTLLPSLLLTPLTVINAKRCRFLYFSFYLSNCLQPLLLQLRRHLKQTLLMLTFAPSARWFSTRRANVKWFGVHVFDIFLPSPYFHLSRYVFPSPYLWMICFCCCCWMFLSLIISHVIHAVNVYSLISHIFVIPTFLLYLVG